MKGLQDLPKTPWKLMGRLINLELAVLVTAIVVIKPYKLTVELDLFG